MTFQRAVQGGRMDIRASDLNAVYDTVQRMIDSQRTGANTGRANTDGTVLIRNDSGGDEDRFHVLGLGDVIITPTDNEGSFTAGPVFSGVTPTAEHAGTFAVLMEPLKSGVIGRARVSGHCVARVDVQDADDDRCGAVVGSGVLESNTDGAAQILWKEAGTGEKWAVVRFGGGGAGGCCPPTFRVKIQAAECDPLTGEVVTTPPGPEADEVQTLCVGGAGRWLRITAHDPDTGEKIDNFDPSFSVKLYFEALPCGVNLSISPDTISPGSWASGEAVVWVEASGPEVDGCGGALLVSALDGMGELDECNGHGWKRAEWEICDGCCLDEDKKWWKVQKETIGIGVECECVYACDRPADEYGPGWRKITIGGSHDTEAECAAAECPGSVADCMFVSMVATYSRSGIIIEKQEIEGVVSPDGNGNWVGSIDRTIYDYFDNGTLCGTRNVPFSFSMVKGEDDCDGPGYRVDYANAYIYTCDSNVFIASWVSVSVTEFFEFECAANGDADLIITDFFNQRATCPD